MLRNITYSGKNSWLCTTKTLQPAPVRSINREEQLPSSQFIRILLEITSTPVGQALAVFK